MMENFKSTLFSIIAFSIFSLLLFWGFSTIESGSNHKDNQIQKNLETKNKSLEEQITILKDEIESLSSKLEIKNTEIDSVKNEEIIPPVVENPTVKNNTTVTVSKYKSLIDELQKIFNDKVYMKKGDQGSRVGSIQNFLNIYNKTSNRIDNDYGATTVALVIKFQKSQGLTADGEIGPTTVSKMINWLKKQ